MNLNLLAFAASVLVILGPFSVHGKCDFLSSPNNAIWATSVNTSSLQSQAMWVLKKIDSKPLDQCLGSIDYYKDLSQVALIALPPFSPIHEYIQSKDIVALQAEWAKLMQDPFKHLKSLNAFIQSAPTGKYKNLCTSLDQIVGVLTSESMPVVMQMLESNSCCTSFLTEILAHTGVKFQELINTLLSSFRKILCMKRYPGIVEEKEFCSQTFVQSIFHPKNWGKTLNNLIRFLQTPNSGGCAAFRGEKFITTVGKPDQFEQAPWDSCSKPWDHLISFVASFPVFETANWNGIKWEHLFQAGKCVRGEDFKAMLPPKMQILVMKKCFHLPNHFALDCGFQTVLIEQLS